MPEVKQYIGDLANAGSIAEFNVEDSEEDWNVQVFEIVKQGNSSYTATFQWYKVNKKNGQISKKFE